MKTKSHSRLKKILKRILLVILTVLVGLIFLFFQYIVGLWPWQFGETKSLTKQEIEARAGTFERNYPEVIKGNWEPGADHMERLLVLDEQRIKDLGVNTVSIVPEYNFRKDRSYYQPDTDIDLSNLVRAKEKGFAVLMGPSFVGIGFGHSYGEKGITKDYYLEVSEKVALEWAAIAEKYQAEFFCPQQELDFMLKSKFKLNDDEIAQTLEDWHNQILPKVKKVYTGRTMTKISEPQRVLKIPGYDYHGMSFFHKSRGMEEFRELAKNNYEIMQNMALENNTEWLVAEAFFPASKKSQAEYFRISAEEYLKVTKKKPSGYLFTAWTMPFLGIKIKDEPSEAVLKIFFNQI